MAEGGVSKAIVLRVLVVAGLMGLIFVGYYLVFQTAIEGELETAKRQEKTLSQKLADAEKSVEAYNRDMEELTKRENRQRELSKILPETTEYPAFLSALQNVANVAGVKLVSWTPEREEVAEYYARVPMRIGVRGRYHQIAKFFYGVGQLDRIINIEDIKVQTEKTGSRGKAEASEGETLLAVEALGTAFHSIPQQAAPAGEKGKRRKTE